MTRNPYDFVLDCSITMAWCFEDESNDYTNSVLELLNSTTAVVPTIWPLEVANVLLMAEKHKRITQVQCGSFIDALASLPIVVDPSTTFRAMHSIFALASHAELTIYDAAYLELAKREGIPLLTMDKALIKAAKKISVSLNLANIEMPSA